MIAWQFPPIVTGGVYRPLSFAKYFAKVGQSLTVVCGEPAKTLQDGGIQLAQQVPPETRVSRVSRRHQRVPGFRFFPQVDGEMSWALSIVSQSLALYRTNRPKVVLASGPPFHNAVAGELLSEIWDVPLVIDYRDEWTQNPMEFVTDTADDRSWEERVNRRASRVVLVSESQRDQHVKTFSLSPSSCSVVTNGWEPEYQNVAPIALPSGFAPDSAIHISFTGLLGKHTCPDEFLQSVHLMLKEDTGVAGRPITLQFVGQQADDCAATLQAHAAAYPGEARIVSLGQRPKAEAMAITQASDILLLINPPHLARYIPGKFYEYVATDRPILVYGSGGEVERVVNETGCGLVVPANDPEGLRNAIRQLVTRDVWNGEQRKKWLAGHSREVQAEKMLQILNEVAA